MDAQLHDFIRVPDWHKAKHVLEKYGDQLSALTRRMAERHHNEFTLDRLVADLRPLAEAQPQPEAPKPQSLPDKEKTDTKGRWVYTLPRKEALPADLQALREECILHLRKQQECRGMMKHLAYFDKSTKEQEKQKRLYALGSTIRSSEHALQDRYARLDYWERHGKYMPGTAPETPMERIKGLVRRQVANTNYLSKHKNSTDPHYISEIAKRRQELDELKKWLDE